MRRESPVKRRNPSGKVVWVARYRGRDGRHHIAKPTWNKGKGTFDGKADAQQAIDEAYGLSDRPTPWAPTSLPGPSAHPRSERTNATNEHRIGRLVDVGVEGIPLKDWPLRELRRRHALVLVDHMLRTEGRATTGAVGILRALSAMAEDAITDEVCDLNPFKGVRIRASDPRAQKKRRRSASSASRMQRFARAAGRYEAMVRFFTDCGLRLGRCCRYGRKTSTARGSRSAVRPRGPDPRGHQDRPWRARRRPRRPGASNPRLDARSPDQPQRPRLPAPLPNATRMPLARAHLLPRPLEACPGSLRPRHPPPRVPPQIRHAYTRCQCQRCRSCGDRKAPG